MPSGTTSNKLAVEAGDVTFDVDNRTFQIDRLLVGLDGSNANAAVTGSGLLALASGITIGDDGLTGTLDVHGAGTVVNQTGGFTYVGATDNGVGNLAIRDGGTLNSTNAIIAWASGASGAATVTDGGTWNLSGDLQIGGYNGADNSDDGTLNVSGGLVDVAGSTTLYAGGNRVNLTGGTLNTGSLILVSADQFNWTGGTLALKGGSLTGPSSITVPSGGLLSGNGIVGGDVAVEGAVAPGESIGRLIIAGDLINFGTLDLEIGGVDATDVDRLDVNGLLSLGGTVRISLIDGFEPEAGDSFDILDFNSFADNGFSFDFSAASLGDGLAWDTSGFATAGVLGVSAIPEPLAAGGVGLLGLVALRRRRGLIG